MIINETLCRTGSPVPLTSVLPDCWTVIFTSVPPLDRPDFEPTGSHRATDAWAKGDTIILAEAWIGGW